MIGGTTCADAEPAYAQRVVETPSPATDNLPYQLEVFINGVSTGLIGAFQRNADGSFSIAPEQWTNLGLRTDPIALTSDGLVLIDLLPGIAYHYDEALQCLRVTTTDPYRLPRRVNARGAATDAPVKVESDVGALVNYTLFANFQNRTLLSLPAYQGMSGTFDGVVFTPYGNFNQTLIAATSTSVYGTPDVIRLNTSWNYFDVPTMTSYTAGDLISGGLAWTRPVRLGGGQIQRNFAVRPDLVTMPVPSLSGSAAVPSTIEVQNNGSRIYTGDIAPGPFQIDNLPITSGPGMARLTLRDASGVSTTIDMPYFSSPSMLAPGLVDFSLEAGFARNFFGVYSNTYDSRPLASGTARYGLSNTLTLEGHAEGGGGLVNGGVGALFTIGPWALASAAVAGSFYENEAGLQIAGSLDLPLGEWRLALRSQRSFGDYQDIASITADLDNTPILEDIAYLTAAPPRAVDQVTLSVPLADAGTLGFNFTNYDQGEVNRFQLAGLSYSRPLFGGTLFANAYADLADIGEYGAFVGLSMPIGARTQASVGAYSGPAGANIVAEASRSEDQQPGSYGWRAAVSEGAQTYRGASASYRGDHGRVQVGALQVDETVGLTATLQGSVVAAGGGVFLGNQIDDSFAVVDVGAPGVTVMSQNRAVGTTGPSGRLLVTGLRRFQENRIGIDPTALPVDADVPETNRTVRPGARSGVVVDFAAKAAGRSALVSFIDAKAAPLPLGAVVTLDGAGASEVIGYDGQAYLRNLASANQVTVELPDGTVCHATFGYEPRRGEQVVIEGVPCI